MGIWDIYNFVVIDFETRYGDGLGFKSQTNSQYVCDARFYVHGMGMEGQWYSSEPVVKAKLDSMDWKRTGVIAQNCFFEGAILEWRFGIKPRFYLDTRLMSRFLWPNESASLTDLAERIWPDDTTMRKGDELVASYNKEFLGDVDAMIGEYCLQDVKLTKGAFEWMKEQVPENELRIIDQTIRQYTRPSIKIDEDILYTLIREEREKKEKVLKQLGVERIQLSSEKQFAELLQMHGVTPPIKISPTTDKPTFAFSKNDLGFQALQKHENKKIRDLAEGRLIVKSVLNETRAERLLGEAANHNGYLPIPLKYRGAHTGRFSGTDGINFQNMPKKGLLRKSLVAPPGHKMVTVDSSQIEPRMLALVTNQQFLLQQFREKQDVYTNFIADTLDRPPDSITSDERFIGKQAILGLGYGMWVDKFISSVERMSYLYLGHAIQLEENQGYEIVKGYRNKFSEIPDLWEKMDRWVMRMKKRKAGWFPRLETEGVVFAIIGDRCMYLPDDSVMFYTAKRLMALFGQRATENLIQALCRILLVHWILLIEQRYQVAFSVHDEITCVVTEDRAEECAKYMQECMAQPLPWCKDIPLATEAIISNHYAK